MGKIIEIAITALIAYGLSTITSIFTEPKKQRINDYNHSIKDFLQEIDKINEKAIIYWSDETPNKQTLSFEIVCRRLECARINNEINKKAPSVYKHSSISNIMHEYFQIITGGTFQTSEHSGDTEVIQKFSTLCSSLKDIISSTKICHKPKHILLTKIN